MRTDSNTLLPIASSSASKKSSMIRAPEKQGAAFSEDFNRAKDAMSGSKYDDKHRVAHADDQRKSSVISEKTSHQPNRDERINSSEKEPVSASKTTPPSAQSNTVDSQSADSESGSVNTEKGAQSVASSTDQVAESGKKLQLSGEASPETSEAAKGNEALMLGGKVVAGSVATDALVKSSGAKVAMLGGKVVAGSVATDALVKSSGAKVAMLGEGQELSNVDELLPVAGEGKTKVSLQETVGDEHVLASNNVQQQGLMEVGQTESVFLDDGTVVQQPNVQALSGMNVSTPQELAQVDGATNGQVDALLADQVVEAPVLEGGDLKKLNESGVIAMAPVAAVATGVNQVMAPGQDASAGSDEELSWVLDQMSSTPKKTSADGVVTGLLAEAPDAERIKSAGLAGAGLALGAAGKLNADSASGSATDLLQGADLALDDVIGNEPLELRKKEHEAMLGRMAGNVDAKMDDVGGLSSSFNQQIGRAAASVGVASQLASANQPLNMAMSVPPGHPNWAAEMGQKVAWVAREGGHTAHIRLDPPELGSLTVKVSVDSDSNTQINFVAATAQARDLLEGQMGRLRDMLAQQGMDLSRAEVDVSQQDASGTQKDAGQTGLANHSDANGEDEADEVMPGVMSYVSATGVDYYA
ncbi:flagellar hook-length control protein FliK [Marinomonas aquiplantarum]|uniref:Flagellar hook-length control protein FliK n=1 Tax=Marinomonas aquiplantarum TaxID=491951 RepID=A0A366D150_9GAMM|nr:flagellar hook-length control protein FliK [Marinomonas aquiplantarum]RBO83229.1 flagellar hook-length control protein FliK [Marinomonas aquiplantarum]